jgi:hypothetical protein
MVDFVILASKLLAVTKECLICLAQQSRKDFAWLFFYRNCSRVDLRDEASKLWSRLIFVRTSAAV